MDDLGNIFNSKYEIDQEQLKKYLDGELPDEEKHIIEKAMIDSPFVNDALEGLKYISSQKKRDDLVENINSTLRKNINAKTGRRRSSKISHIWWSILSVALILLLAAVSILLIRWFKEKEAKINTGMTSRYSEHQTVSQNIISTDSSSYFF